MGRSRMDRLDDEMVYTGAFHVTMGRLVRQFRALTFRCERST